MKQIFCYKCYSNPALQNYIQTAERTQRNSDNLLQNKTSPQTPTLSGDKELHSDAEAEPQPGSGGALPHREKLWGSPWGGSQNELLLNHAEHN